MMSARATLARGLATARHARSLPVRAAQRNLKPALRRGYASGNSHGASSSSDIPWLIGSIGVTVPVVYYLWPEKHEGGHGDHGDHGAHEEKHEPEEAEEEETEDKADDDEKADKPKPESDKEEKEDKQDNKEEAGKDDKEQKEEKSDDKSDDKSEKEGEKSSNKKVDGVQFKGKTSAGDENNEQTDTRKREPDGKGAYKKRIDSDYQKELGAGAQKTEDGRPTGASAAEKSGNPGAIDTKQAGLSTTPTRHSTKIDEDPEKSKKPSGAPETAKSQTSVDPEQGKKK